MITVDFDNGHATVSLSLFDDTYAPTSPLPPNYFKDRYEGLSGKDWLRNIDKEDRVALAKIANAASGYGRNGGVVRANTAKRDSRGRFISNR